jgi:hypothetical protein
VTYVGQAGVDATRAAVPLDHLRAFREGQGTYEVASCIGWPPAYIWRRRIRALSRLEPKPLGDLWGRGHRPELDQLDAGLRAELAHLHVVGASAGAAALRHALVKVAGKPPDRGPGANEDAGPCSLRTRPSPLSTSIAWPAVIRVTP